LINLSVVGEAGFPLENTKVPEVGVTFPCGGEVTAGLLPALKLNPAADADGAAPNTFRGGCGEPNDRPAGAGELMDCGC